MTTTEVKDRIIKINDIPTDAKVLNLQYSKPIYSYVVCGLLLFVLFYFPETRIIGIFGAAFFIFIFTSSKNRKLLLVTDKFVASFNPDLETARIIYYDEVKNWEIVEAHDVYSLAFNLDDGSALGMQTTNHYKVVKIFKKIMPEKENKHEIKLFAKKETNTETKRGFSGLNLFKKKKKK